MTQRSQARAVLTDSHFLIPAAVFLAGITLLVLMH
ncbi:translocated intimin receptor Tir [Occallatibacter riparius]|uniref:Translocated intimin receptor Tir n=1 Tax=Occallatibacter riparius TaxID=1002689 RepID=A0A9J7BSS9_9BACT|nr:translocated intimin receptor Tir [Occallatibacter riparius]UWZ85704.1 translocated intimin receptor Tir [Occallatibacter riparius]